MEDRTITDLITESMSMIETEIEIVMKQFIKDINNSNEAVEKSEIKTTKTINSMIDSLYREINYLSTNVTVGLPHTKLSKYSIRLMGDDVNIDQFVKNCLEQLTLMRVITQNIQDAYKTMNTIVTKRERCEELIQSYITETKTMQSWLK
ncbi:Uncharacterized protein QTN25_005691 [Entamoeba marina]